MAAFKNMTRGESLDQFHQRCVVPSPEETNRRNQVIDEFVRFLHQQFNEPPCTVARVLKSGSLGKGTAARDSADIDLVVILNGLTDVTKLTTQRGRLLDRLGRCVDDYGGWGSDRPRLTTRRRFSLKYTLHGEDMDILPAMDIDSTYGTLNAVYQQMTGVDMAWEFSASLTSWQIDFVKPEGEAVKKVIRLLKYWRHGKGLKIRPYTLELLTINTQRTVHWTDTSSLFRNVLSRLADCGSIRVAFDKHYPSSQYTRQHTAPYVLDPANPYMNTMEGANVAAVSREARAMLNRL